MASAPLEQYLVIMVTAGPFACAVGAGLIASAIRRQWIQKRTFAGLFVLSAIGPVVLHLIGHLLGKALKLSFAMDQPFTAEAAVEIGWYIIWTVVVAAAPATIIYSGSAGPRVRRVIVAVASVSPIFIAASLPALVNSTRTMLTQVNFVQNGELSSTLPQDLTIIFVDAESSSVKMAHLRQGLAGAELVLDNFNYRNYLFATQPMGGGVAVSFTSQPRVRQAELDHQSAILYIPDARRASVFSKERMSNQDVRLRTALLHTGVSSWTFSSDHTPERTIVAKSINGDILSFGYYTPTSVASFSRILPVETGRWQSSYLTHISDSMVLFQARLDEIWLFDAATRKIERIGRGRCPIVIAGPIQN